MNVAPVSLRRGLVTAATALLEVPAVGSPDVLDRDAAASRRRNAAHLFAIMIGVLVIASASAFGGYRSGQPATAALSTTDVPAVLGLGRTGAESLLRNAHLVPRFEFLHRADVASLGTVIKQSPNGGDTAAINSTVVVMINIGSWRDDIAIPYAGVARRPPTWPSSISDICLQPNCNEMCWAPGESSRFASRSGPDRIPQI
jgi:hypothetical protein